MYEDDEYVLCSRKIRFSNSTVYMSFVSIAISNTASHPFGSVKRAREGREPQFIEISLCKFDSVVFHIAMDQLF